jgi:hypothetical protein
MTGCQPIADHCEQIKPHHIEINPKRSTGADMNSAVTRIILEQEIALSCHCIGVFSDAVSPKTLTSGQTNAGRKALRARSGHAVAGDLCQCATVTESSQKQWLHIQRKPRRALRPQSGHAVAYEIPAGYLSASRSLCPNSDWVFTMALCSGNVWKA